MTQVQINLHDRKRPSFMVSVLLPRVPVIGDVIHHDDIEYVVTAVIFYTNGKRPYIVAKVPV